LSWESLAEYCRIIMGTGLLRKSSVQNRSASFY
jgi:hypothetical protein